MEAGEMEALFSPDVVPSLELDRVHLLLDQVFLVALSDFRDKFNMLAPYLPAQIQEYTRFIHFSHMCSKFAEESTVGRNPENILGLLNAQAHRHRELPVLSDILQLRTTISKGFLFRPRLMRLAHLGLLHWRKACSLPFHVSWTELLPRNVLLLVWPHDVHSGARLLDSIENYSSKLHVPTNWSEVPSFDILESKLKKCFDEELIKHEWILHPLDRIALNVLDYGLWTRSGKHTASVKMAECFSSSYEERIEGLTFFVPTPGRGKQETGHDLSLWNRALSCCYFLLKYVLHACKDHESDFLKVADYFLWPLNTLQGINAVCVHLRDYFSERHHLRPEVIFIQIKDELVDALRIHARIPPGLADILENRHILSEHVLCRHRLMQLARLKLSVWKTDVFGEPYDRSWSEICCTRTGLELVFPDMSLEEVTKELDSMDPVKPASHVTLDYISYKWNLALQSGLVKLDWLTSKSERIAYLVVQGNLCRNFL